MKDIALDEITLRKYEIPEKKEKRELIKKFCLSLGLLQEGDNRDVIIDIFIALLKAKSERKLLSSNEIKDYVEKIRKSHGLDLRGISESNIRRQLKRIRDLMLVEKIKNSYRITEFMSIDELIDKLYEIKLKGILKRIREYAKAIDGID